MAGDQTLSKYLNKYPQTKPAINIRAKKPVPILIGRIVKI